MSGTPGTLAPYYEGWGRYNALLVEAISPLTAAQLALSASPALSPVWRLAAHIVGARFGWYTQLLKEPPPPEVTGRWDSDDAAPRRAAELVVGLESTWRMIEASLNRWSPDLLADKFSRERGGQTYTFSRQWVLWHLIEHDLHHGGELFLTLGMHGLATPDL